MLGEYPKKPHTPNARRLAKASCFWQHLEVFEVTSFSSCGSRTGRKQTWPIGLPNRGSEMSILASFANEFVVGYKMLLWFP